MISKVLKIGMVGLLVVVGVAGIFWLRKSNGELRQRAAGLRRQSEQLGQLRAQNDHARELIAHAAAGSGNATPTLQAEVDRVRTEIAELERRGEARRAATSDGVAALAANRDPERGLVLTGNFPNAGQATPSAALQTLVWAATKGDDQRVATLLTFDGAAREKALALVANLPEAARAKYPTPESLAALFFANFITAHEAARVMGQDVRDAGHATVTIGFERMPTGQPFPMQLGPDGWQLVVADAMMPEFQRQVRGRPESPQKK